MQKQKPWLHPLGDLVHGGKHSLGGFHTDQSAQRGASHLGRGDGWGEQTSGQGWDGGPEMEPTGWNQCGPASPTPWTAAHQAPPSMGFSRQEYWSGVPLPSLHSYVIHFKHGKIYLFAFLFHPFPTFTSTFHFHALEKEMAVHSSVLAWRIPGMGEPGGLPSMGSHRVGHN